MRDFITQYKYRKEMTDKQNQKEIKKTQIGSKLGSFLDSFIVYVVLLFIAALLTLAVTLVVMYMVCGQSKLKALVANIALQHTKAVEAANSPIRYCLYEKRLVYRGLTFNNVIGNNLSCHV